ncbi:hypothetical protein D9M73_143130 [compost metagenome]
MPLTSTPAGFGWRLSMVPICPLSCWMAVAKLGVRLKSAKLAEPSLMKMPPMWMPNGFSLLAGLFAAGFAPESAGCGISRSSMLVVRSSLIMKRA